MTQLSKQAIISKFNDSLIGLYKDGQTLGITAAKHRTMVEDLVDSLVSYDDIGENEARFVQLFYETPGMGTATAAWNWDSANDGIGILVADYADITIDFQNRAVGSKATLLVTKTISGDVVLTIPESQAVGDSVTSTEITLSGSTDTIFRIDFWTVSSSGFTLVNITSPTFTKMIHTSATDIYAIDGSEILYKSTNSGLSFSTFYTATTAETGVTVAINDFDISGTTIYLLAFLRASGGNLRFVEHHRSDNTGGTWSQQIIGVLNLGKVKIYAANKIYFALTENSTARFVYYNFTAGGFEAQTINVTDGNSSDRSPAADIAQSGTTLIILTNNSVNGFASQFIRRISDYAFEAETVGNISTQVQFYGLALSSTTVGVAVGRDGAGDPAIYKTTDGGATWTVKTVDAAVGILRGVKYYSSTFIAIGDSGIATSPDGDTWTVFANPVNGQSISAFNGTNILISASADNLYKGFGSSVPDVYDLVVKPDTSAAEILTATVSISSAEILALNATPKELIAAPGAGKIIDVISCEVYLDYNSIAYATNTNLYVSYNASGGDLHSTAFGIAAGAFDYFTKISLDNQTAYNTSVRVNTPLVAYVSSGNPTAGNSTIKVFLTYKIITI